MSQSRFERFTSSTKKFFNSLTAKSPRENLQDYLFSDAAQDEEFVKYLNQYLKLLYADPHIIFDKKILKLKNSKNENMLHLIAKHNAIELSMFLNLDIFATVSGNYRLSEALQVKDSNKETPGDILKKWREAQEAKANTVIIKIFDIEYCQNKHFRIQKNEKIFMHDMQHQLVNKPLPQTLPELMHEDLSDSEEEEEKSIIDSKYELKPESQSPLKK